MMADIVKLLEEYLAEHDVPPFHTTLRNGVPVRRIYEAILYLNDQLEEARNAMVPVVPTPEQVAQAVWIASKEEPTQADKELAAAACMDLSGAWKIDSEGDMVSAISEMLRDHRAMLKASEGGK